MIDYTLQKDLCIASLESDVSSEFPDTLKLQSETEHDCQFDKKPSNGVKRGRKSHKGAKLHRLTIEESKFLQAHFDSNPNWDRDTRQRLAAELKVPESKVYKWWFDKRQQLKQKLHKSKGIKIIKCKMVENSDNVDRFLRSAIRKFHHPAFDFNLEVEHLIDSWDNILKNTSVGNECFSNQETCDVSSSIRKHEHLPEDQRITTDSTLYEESNQTPDDDMVAFLDRMDDQLKSLISEDLKFNLSDEPCFENFGTEDSYFNLIP